MMLVRTSLIRRIYPNGSGFSGCRAFGYGWVPGTDIADPKNSGWVPGIDIGDPKIPGGFRVSISYT